MPAASSPCSGSGVRARPARPSFSPSQSARPPASGALAQSWQPPQEQADAYLQRSGDLVDVRVLGHVISLDLQVDRTNGAERRGPAQGAAVGDEAPARGDEADDAAEEDRNPGARAVCEPAEDR